MSVEIIQYTAQKQKLILSLSMKQSLNILQMPIQQLQLEIENALVDNPLLEESEDNEEDILEKMLSNNVEMENKGVEVKDYEDIFNSIAEKRTLKDYLKEQISDLDLSQTMANICRYIIENLDDNGYLGVSDSEIAIMLEIDRATVDMAVSHIQTLEPSGIGARDLQECLCIQLHRKNLLNDKMKELINEYLQLIGTHKFSEIAKKMHLSMQEVQHMCMEIKKLEPKPARGFFSGDVEDYIIPEAYIRKIGDEWYILMNNNALPRLYISKTYQDIIKGKEDLQACEYIKEKMKSAMGLLKGIEKRQQTIYSILEQIIKLQEAYFEWGESHLKPMSIKEVSDRIGVHESTVSRAIKDKYISTSIGTILLKKIFTTGIESGKNQEEISSFVIKKMIKSLIDEESTQKPFSDQQLCERLLEKQVNISRRTVAKYREAMGIPTASMRKKYEA